MKRCDSGPPVPDSTCEMIRHDIEKTGRSEAVVPPRYRHHAPAPATDR